MRADDLQQAVGRIARILETADVRAAVDRFRASRGDDRTVAAARLGHAGALISERLQQLSAADRGVLARLHLSDLARPAYWEELLGSAGSAGAGNGDVVKLAARLMFVSQNLPGLMALLGDRSDDAPLADGEARLATRLIDAGERASDPDRIARSIDGIDMLYSACASIARRPAIDLRLDRIDGRDTRDMHFIGGRDAVQAVVAVIESIPAALAEIDENADLDLDAIVASLQVFADLKTLASLGTFSDSDLRDISETMHQGALLVLESGVVLAPAASQAPTGQAPAAKPRSTADAPADVEPPVLRQAAPTAPAAPASPPAKTNGSGAPAATADKHYDEYLRERAAMQRAASEDSAPRSAPSARRGNGQSQADFSEADLTRSDVRDDGAADQQRRDAVEALLQSLAKARGD